MIFDRWLPEVKTAGVPIPPAAPSTPPTPAAPGASATTPPPAAPITRPGRGPGLPPGRSLVLGIIPPPPLGAVDEGETEAAFFSAGAADHPALRLAGLDKVDIGKGRKVRLLPETPVKDIASTTVGPGVLEVTDASTLALVVPFNVLDSTWYLDPGWVLFLASSTLYLSDAAIGSAGAGLVGDTMHVGETLSTRLPTGATDVRLTLPDNERLTLEPGADGNIAFGPVARTGIYTVSWLGQGTASDVEIDGRIRRPIAANLLSPDESNISARAQLGLAREIVQAQTQKEVTLTRKLWPWLLLGALMFVMFEWWVYNRKVMI
jgi:hypothetical protein